MRKARAFSTPGDVVGGGGVALLPKKEDMVLAVHCRWAVWLGTGSQPI